MKILNINTGAEWDGNPIVVGETQNVTWENAPELMQSVGWRLEAELEPETPEGSKRIYRMPVDIDGVTCRWNTVDRLFSDIEAENLAKRNQSFIDAGLVPVASLYRATLRKHFGDNAETNHEVTQASVASYFLNKYAQGTLTQADGDDRDMLLFGFDQLTAWSKTNNTWSESIPWEVVT